MPCPYRDLHELCSVEWRDCTREGPHKDCPTYREERRRLRAVTAVCPHAKRRRWGSPGIGGGVRYDHWVWCHAKKEPHICYGTPEECPDYLWTIIRALQRRLREDS